MIENLDRNWWKSMRLRLETDLEQQAIVIRCMAMEQL
jgi:hypothetical protein